MTETTLTTRIGTYRLLAELPLRIERCEVSALRERGRGSRDRCTTVIELSGDGETGAGEDIAAAKPEPLLLTGRWTIESFSSHLDSLAAITSQRRWALESAALDLALRQAGRSLADVLGIAPRAVAFVATLNLPEPPAIPPVDAALLLNQSLRLRLEPTSAWSEPLLARLTATGRVSILDLRGQHPHGTQTASPPDERLYARLLAAFPGVWIEDPAVTPATAELLQAHRAQVAWDAPIRVPTDIDSMPLEPHAINVSPARIGRLQAVLDIIDHCAARGIKTYAGASSGVGPGCQHALYLAALLYPNAPNELAPVEHGPDMRSAEALKCPTTVAVAPTGFRLEPGTWGTR